MPKKNYMDLQKSLPLVLIDEGKFDKRNLTLTQKSKEYFLDVLKKEGCKDEKNILVMTVDGNGKVYLQKQGEKYKIIQLQWEEKLW